MNNKELALKVVGLILSAGFGIAGLIIEHKKTIKLSVEDKEDIADRVVSRLPMSIIKK